METQVMDYDNYMPRTAEKSVTAEAMISRQAQEVQAAMIIAKRYPRDTYQAFQNIMKACDRKKLAESAEYEYTKGGSSVTGPSIRLAEVVAQNWGNMDFGVMELEQRVGESQCMSYAWDLETNTRQTMLFTVKHERKARGSTVKLTDSRDIYELVANMGARRVRKCILGVIPGDVIEAAQERCRKTLIEGHKEPLETRLRQALELFKKNYGVTKEMIEKNSGKNLDSFTENDFLKVGRIYNSLKDGMSSPQEHFEMGQKPKEDVKSSVLDEFEEHLKNTEKGGVPDADPNQSELPL